MLSRTLLQLLALCMSCCAAERQSALNTTSTLTSLHRQLDNIALTTSSSAATSTRRIYHCGNDPRIRSPRRWSIQRVQDELLSLLRWNDFGCLNDGLDDHGQPLYPGWRPAEKNVTREMIFTEKRKRIELDALELMREFERDEYDCYAGTSWGPYNTAKATTSRTLSPRGLETYIRTMSTTTVTWVYYKCDMGNPKITTSTTTTTAPGSLPTKRWCGTDKLEFIPSPRQKAIADVRHKTSLFFETDDFGCLPGDRSHVDLLATGWTPAKDNVTKAELFTDNRARIGAEIDKLLLDFEINEFDCYANSSVNDG